MTEEKKQLLEKAYSSLILGLGDKVLREVKKETTASGIWGKLETLYMRLAHVSEKGLMELSKQGLLCGDKLDKLSFCDHCVYGKMIRVKFNKFKDWKVMNENQSGKRVKRLRTDNGLEYCNEGIAMMILIGIAMNMAFVTSSSNTPIEVEQSGFEVELTGKNFEQNHDQLQVPVQSVNDSDEVVVQHDDLEDYNLTRDRVRREVRAPNSFGYADIVAYALQVTGEVNDEPRNYQDAVTRSDSLLWKKAMSEEFESLQKKQDLDIG
ncbi:hypothetical protein EZV62_018717 [Acer yangbiense]|uniref:GAG-pre-integrase domain-containing protein n=1 Tax=Acer yangbiense TaxID=1000413 RepID=A0A5C7HKH8_9ROSI|nr:hypothetical protein EZV62_018717 [Acer yangbiense]